MHVSKNDMHGKYEGYWRRQFNSSVAKISPMYFILYWHANKNPMDIILLKKLTYSLYPSVYYRLNFDGPSFICSHARRQSDEVTTSNAIYNKFYTGLHEERDNFLSINLKHLTWDL